MRLALEGGDEASFFNTYKWHNFSIYKIWWVYNMITQPQADWGISRRLRFHHSRSVGFVHGLSRRKVDPVGRRIATETEPTILGYIAGWILHLGGYRFQHSHPIERRFDPFSFLLSERFSPPTIVPILSLTHCAYFQIKTELNRQVIRLQSAI